MKKILTIFLALLLGAGLPACAQKPAPVPAENGALTNAPASEGAPATETPRKTPESARETGEPAPAPEKKTVLVAFFSATGTTKAVAEKLAAIENADLYEIKAAKEYTSADLNWSDRNSRSTSEQNGKSARPEIGSERLSLEGYTKIYLGFPIWWGEEPRILDTFVESYSFDGVTVIPFCTSGSSGIGRSGQNLAENAKSGKWLDGRRFGSGASESELRAWTDSLK